MIIQLILIQVLTFAVVIAAFYLLSGRHLQNAMTRMQALHQENLEKEEVLNKELERAKVLSQGEIARGRDEARRIVEDARREAEKATRESGEKAETAARKLIQEAADRAKRMEVEILSSVEERARVLAREALRYVFTDEHHQGFHGQLVREFIEELKKTEDTKLSVKTDRVEVLTPWPLASSDRRALQEVLSAKLGCAVTLEEIAEPALVLGVVVKMGALVIDGSFKNKLGKAMAILEDRRPV